MILVTVGTTMPFDELIEVVDRLAPSLGEPVECQYGQSAYRPVNCRGFMAVPNLRSMIDQASLVITHGGATVTELLMARKPFVAFPNPRGDGDHQGHFLERISKIASISWSRDVLDLERLIAERRQSGPARVLSSIPRIADDIAEMLRHG